MEVSSVRRVVVRLTISSFALAALIGIAALLVPGRLGSVQGRILLTTLVVGVTSVLTLCYLAVSGTRYQPVAVLGGVAALVAAVTVLDLVWAHWQHDPGVALVRTFGVSGILALTLAQFTLLLALALRGGEVTRVTGATLVLGSALAVMMCATVLGWQPGDVAVRVVGVVAILDVLGTVVTTALGLFGSGRRRGAGTLTVVVPEPLTTQLRARAAETGADPAALVLDAVAGLVAPMPTDPTPPRVPSAVGEPATRPPAGHR